MVYHEIRKVNGNIQNYLVYNMRKKGKWVKKSKFIGSKALNKKDILEKKKEFERALLVNKKYLFLKKKQVERIEDLKNIYSNKIKSFNNEEFKQFKGAFFTELTYDSNAIEGNSLSLQETSLVLNERIVPEGKTLREIYEVKNHAMALNFLEKYKGSFNEGFILKLHSLILKDISQRFAGRYRKSSIRVAGSNFKFPSAEKVPPLIKNLIWWYKKNRNKYHPFEMAILVSMKLVSIHPFIDGNGRLSRLVMNFLLDKKAYPWINIYNKQKEKYLKYVRKANDEDYVLIFPFLIKTLEQNLKDFEIIH